VGTTVCGRRRDLTKVRTTGLSVSFIPFPFPPSLPIDTKRRRNGRAPRSRARSDGVGDNRSAATTGFISRRFSLVSRAQHRRCNPPLILYHCSARGGCSDPEVRWVGEAEGFVGPFKVSTSGGLACVAYFPRPFTAYLFSIRPSHPLPPISSTFG
jgi:hypothetical protein